MQDMVEATLAAAGFDHYETSAFARPGRQCRHNLNYWEFGDYLGIGAGAHSKLSRADGSHRARCPAARTEGLPRRSGQPPLAGRSTAADLPGEFMMNALRLSATASHPALFERAHRPAARRHRKVGAGGTARGLLRSRDDRIRPTPRGRRYLNRLLELFLADA